MERQPKRTVDLAEADQPPVDEPTLASWRETYRRRRPAEACPDDEALASLVLEASTLVPEASAPDESRDDALLEHVVRCPRCVQAVRDLWELDREARRLSRPRLRWSWSVAAGIAVLFAGALAWMLLAPPPVEVGDPLVLRGADTDVVPADGATLSAVPGGLSWPPQTGATSYRVELRDATGESVWASPDLEQTSLDLPAEVVDGLEPGSYYWVVEVGGPVARPRLGPYWWTFTPPDV